MRILVTPLAVTTHVFQLIPLAWACRAAGHDVVLAAQPRVLETINRAGLTAVPVGGARDFQTLSVEFARRYPELLRGERPSTPPVIQPWIDTAEDVAPDLVRFAGSWQPDLVVTDPMCYAGPLVAEVLEVPLVRFLWGPDWTKSGFGMGGFAEGQRELPPWPPKLVRLFESYGARTAVDFAACTIDPFPPSLQLPGLANRVTMRQVPYNGSGVLPDWLAEPPARPRVCVTWGTTTTRYLGDESFLVPPILAGLAGLDVEVVLTISSADREQIGDVPPGTRVVENLPLDVLLPSCAAIVHQGGAGTMATAAVHGVPQVVVPAYGDQPTNAAQLAAIGVGVRLDASTLDAEAARSAVAAVVFGADHRAAARRLREENLAQPAPAEIVAVLERVARVGRPGLGRSA